ncbi:MAG: hypothetical protein D6693_01385 [Planctomycetota bacterium]|nr:MAG: hypothetical protein D6693_01385 [Planctomycetota bacterium]
MAVGVTSAQAAFTGVLIQETGASDATQTTLRVWAMFDGPGVDISASPPSLPGGNDNIVLDTTLVDINTSVGTFFVPNTIIGPSIRWLAGLNDNGSWGVIGGLNAFTDPINTTPGADIGGALGNGAANNFGNGQGWRNDNPPNNGGQAGSGPQPTGTTDFGLLLFQFVIAGRAGDNTINSFSPVGTGIFNDQFGNPVTDTTVDGLGFLSGFFQIGTRNPDKPLVHRITFGSGPVIPTPGSLALFGLAGLAAARRRR